MLELKNLQKDYNGFPAVKGITFDLSPGDILGFIGANGAGKTTTIRMLATLLEPSAGTATLDGYDIVSHPVEVRRRLGYMPDFFGLYDDVKVWEYLDFFAAIYRVPRAERKAVIDQALELTDLTIKREAFVQSLSRGMQQRLCLAKCLVHDPTLLLLDEPASGLDPRARAELRELLLELSRMGKILIVSSHILPELSDFCNKVAIVERGEMLAFGPIHELVKQMHQVRRFRLRVLGDPTGAIASLRSNPNIGEVAVLSTHDIAFESTLDDEATVGVLRGLVEAGQPVIGFHEETVDLQDVFMRVTTGAVN